MVRRRAQIYGVERVFLQTGKGILVLGAGDGIGVAVFVRAGDDIVGGIILAVHFQHKLFRGGTDNAQGSNPDKVPTEEEIKRRTEKQHDAENDAQRGGKGHLML